MHIRRVVEIQIGPSHKAYEWCSRQCFKARLLRDNLNWIKRQYFIDNGDAISASQLYQEAKKSQFWSLFGHSQISKGVLRQLKQEWGSFYAAMKSYKKTPDKFKSRPKIPGYSKNKNGYSQVNYTVGQNNSPCVIGGGIIRFLGEDKIEMPLNIKIDGTIKQVSITKKQGCFCLLINYIKNPISDTPNLDGNRIAAVDLGVNNLASLTTNVGIAPMLYSGRHIKSINQYYNKVVGKLQSLLLNGTKSSNKIQRITRKRNNRIKNELHRTTNDIVANLIQNGIGTLVIGNNTGWKQNINIGKRNNQNFVGIPFYKLINQLKYKFEEYGGIVAIREESYTSKASFLDNDPIPTYNGDHKQIKFSGRRIKRGLYKSGGGKLINADVNGSYNIMRKAFPNAFADGIEAVIVQPVRMKVGTNFHGVSYT